MSRQPTRIKAVPKIDDYQVIRIGVGGATEKDVLEDPSTGERYIAKLGGRNSDLEVITEDAIFLIGKSLASRCQV